MKTKIVRPKSNKVKIITFGYYVNKNGKKSYGFVKPDARKKDQKIIVKYGFDTFTLSKVPNKRERKYLKKNIQKSIEKKNKSIKNIKIIPVKKKFIKTEFIKSKLYEFRDHKRQKAIEVSTIEDFSTIFSSAFLEAIIIGAERLVYTVKLKVKFRARKNYSYINEYWLYSQTYYSDLDDETIQTEADKILNIIVDKFSQILVDYNTVSIELINEVTWIYAD